MIGILIGVGNRGEQAREEVVEQEAPKERGVGTPGEKEEGEDRPMLKTRTMTDS